MRTVPERCKVFRADAKEGLERSDKGNSRTELREVRAAANIARHELIGLEIEVVEAKNKSLIGRKGAITDETRDALKINENGKEITMMKNAIVFRTKIGGKTVEIDGSCLLGRPEDRAKGRK